MMGARPTELLLLQTSRAIWGLLLKRFKDSYRNCPDCTIFESEAKANIRCKKHEEENQWLMGDFQWAIVDAETEIAQASWAREDKIGEEKHVGEVKECGNIPSISKKV